MIIYQRENFTMSRVCPVYTLLVYALVTHLYGMLAEGVKIHDVKFFDGEELVTIYKISLQRCVCECKAKKNRCLSVNYKRAFTSCRLNVNKPNTEEELFDKPGSVYIEMDDDVISGCDSYKIASNADTSVVPFNQPACGKPGQKANASTMGNVYSNGSRIKYVCSERFKQLDQTESVSVCLHNESWSHINFTCKPDTIGKTCSSNQECVEQLSECRDGLCFCIRNHSYSLTEYACVPRFIGRGNYIISGPNVIPNENFVASSSYGEPADSHKPWLARLDSEDIYAFSTTYRCGCWAAQYNDKQQFIQVDMTNSQCVTAVTTKGRDPKTYTQFVKSYKVLYSVDGVSFITVMDHNGKDMIFIGNTQNETNSTVTNELPCPIQARYIRINPQDWHQHISLRFDVIGTTIHSADCDFENGTCGWQNEAASVIQWHTGKPNNTEGGPVHDHTYSGDKRSTDPVTAGTYLYITTIQQEQVTAQISVSIKESNVSRCLSLWHTASKNYSGSLNVITAKCNIGIEQLRNTTHTNFAETWNLSTVRVESGVYKIVIEGVWTSATGGVLAIDDVTLNETDCS
ncbi:hypothetical protein ACJMK2_019821 [Sinanodonta woodiana]|uniref:Uncharacterized protein n=1 Tax=Sinanodonta woodiana TaxID=1069815 RepID=A0ABD3TXG8_SINWO